MSATLAQLREQMATGSATSATAENGDKNSTVDKDSLERQNNEMLMKILYNNYKLSKKNSGSKRDTAKNAAHQTTQQKRSGK